MIRARRAVERVAEYKPQPEGREAMLRLDLNENTVGCPPALVRSIRCAMTPRWCSVYPEYEKSRASLARHFGVNPAELIVTNGVDDSIMLICDTFVDPGDLLVIPSPTFSIYQFFHEVAGGKTRRVRYDSQARLSMAKLTVAGKRARWMALANPNNPTGTLISPPDLEALLRALPRTVVLVDEAYFDFSGVTILPWIRRFPNLIVSRTLSKAYGLAALRIGLMFANRHLAGLMQRIHAVYAVNGLAAVAASEATKHTRAVERYSEMIRRNRKSFCRKLDLMRIPYIRSSANFVLTHVGPRSPELVKKMRQRGILVRGWPGDRELAECVRITIGSADQMRRAARALNEQRGLLQPDGRKTAEPRFGGWFA